MNHEDRYPAWFLWMLDKEHFLVIFMAGILLVISAFVGTTVYFEHRLGEVDAKLRYVPPRHFEDQSLDEFRIEETEISQFPVKQLVYVPVYSHVYADGGGPYPIETTLSIRNTDVDESIFIRFVSYYNTAGEFVEHYLQEPIRLAPLQTVEFLVEGRDSSGGSGANFLVEWRAAQDTNKPLIECVMVGTAGPRGICFNRVGIEIQEPDVSLPFQNEQAK